MLIFVTSDMRFQLFSLYPKTRTQAFRPGCGWTASRPLMAAAPMGAALGSRAIWMPHSSRCVHQYNRICVVRMTHSQYMSNYAFRNVPEGIRMHTQVHAYTTAAMHAMAYLCKYVRK